MEENKSTLERKLLYLVVPLFVIFVGWFAFMMKDTYFPPKSLHYHAGFIVVKDDRLVDFSDIQYMHTMPCGDHTNEKKSPEEMQIEKAHLHDYIGDVVHVHREGAAWKDLFTNLKYPINYDETEVYMGEKKVQNLKGLRIKPYQSLVIFIGKNDVQKHLKEAVTKKHIQEVEKRSDNCGV